MFCALTLQLPSPGPGSKRANYAHILLFNVTVNVEWLKTAVSREDLRQCLILINMISYSILAHSTGFCFIGQSSYVNHKCHSQMFLLKASTIGILHLLPQVRSHL